jgi:uncharacterized repeat protein (TIGR01451 family)
MKLQLLFLPFLFILKANSQIDTIPPVITMHGADTVYHEVLFAYNDAGASAYDQHDGVVQVTVVSAVDTQKIGIYIVKYSAQDSAGNQSINKFRVVIVRDTIKPTIKLIGPNVITICRGLSQIFIDLGVIASDNYYDTSSLTISVFGIPDNNYGTFYIHYIAVDPSGNSSDILTREFIVSGNCIGGTVYFDKNKNCNYDSTEVHSKEVKLQFRNIATSQTTLVFPDIYGYYEPNPLLDTGKYWVKVIPSKPYINTACITDSFYYADTLNSTYIKDIAITDTLFADMSITSEPNAKHRWNNYNNLRLYASNEGTLDLHLAKFELTIPVGITINSSLSSYDSLSANKLFWHYDTIPPGSRNDFILWYTADTSIFHLNDTIVFQVNSKCNETEIDLNNNVSTIKRHIVGSYDPNEKTSSQPSILKPGTIDFNYSVLFQNTGNAEAFDVQVNDTIDSRFDLNTLQITEASHRYRMFIKNNVLIVRFEEIYLPDSHANEPKSHGFFSYSLKLKKALALHEEIKNTAYIYFDNNPSIVTNTTSNKYELTGINTNMGKPEAIFVYPNPAHALITIRNLNHDKIILYDVLGKEVLNTTSSTLDVSALPKGIYILKINNSVTKLIKE